MPENSIPSFETLRRIPQFAEVPDADLHRIAEIPQQVLPAGTLMQKAGVVSSRILCLLQGDFRFERVEAATNVPPFRFQQDPPLLIGDVGLVMQMASPYQSTTVTDCTVIEIGEEKAWRLMAEMPGFRVAILNSAHQRFNMRLDMDHREEKLAALGTLTAGLMHELNNPGAAAGRAAKQLRENLNRMHELAKKFSQEKAHHSPEQMRCFWEMQERALRRKRVDYLNSLEQSDAEEALAEWLESNHVNEAWRIAPTFANAGITGNELECLKADVGMLSGAELEWMAAMVGGIQLADTIEESINRVSALVGAVKTYTHEGQGNTQKIDINQSVFSTIVILKHKMREKNIQMVKEFGADLPVIASRHSSLNQVWTNLLDNAIAAAGDNGEVRVRTWKENDALFVSVADNGPGIPLEKQTHIFDPFFTTKPQGEGTGLGLGIAYQIVREYGGALHFSSRPGETTFTVHLPLSAE